MQQQSDLSALGRVLVAAALALPLAAYADEAELTRRLDNLSKELEAVKAELARMKKEREQQPAAGAPPKAATAPTQTAQPAQTQTPYVNSEAAPSAGGEPDTVITSY